MSANVPWWEESLAEDIHRCLLAKEKTLASYRGQSPQLHQRRFLVDWLAVVCEELGVCNEAKHLSVCILDYFMDHFEIDPERIYLFALGCLLVACKFEELDANIPRWHHLDRFIINSEYESAHYQQMELILLGFFNWNICMPTACHFAPYYTMTSLEYEREHLPNPSWIEKITIYLDKYVKYFLEISLQDPVYRFQPPSLVSVSCVVASRECMQLRPIWPESLSRVTSFTWDQVSVPVRQMLLSYQIDDKATREQNTPSRSLQDSGYCSTDCSTPSPAQCRNVDDSNGHSYYCADVNNNGGDEVDKSRLPCVTTKNAQSYSCQPCRSSHYPGSDTVTSTNALMHCSTVSNESGMSSAASPTQMELVANFNEDLALAKWS